jgi:pyruvate-formate lyase
LNSEFLLNALHALAPFQGFRNRLASFWTKLVVVKAAKRQQPKEQFKLEPVIHAEYASGMTVEREEISIGFSLDVLHALVHL